MMRWTLSRRCLSVALIALAAAPSAHAQDLEGAVAWARAEALIWAEILRVPVNLLGDASFYPSLHSTRGESERAEARERAATRRATLEADIARCRALVSASSPAPEIEEGWEQTILRQIPADQSRALDRLALLAAFLEANSNDSASGAATFPAAMRMANWALFGEIDWIMASAAKVSRIGQVRDSFVDLWSRTTVLDWLTSSVNRGVLVRIVHGDPPEHIAEAQAAMAAASAEMRALAGLFATADQRPLNVPGQSRSRVRAALPGLSALAETHARLLDDIAHAWPSLTPAQLVADDAHYDFLPSFMSEAEPLLRDDLPT